jgi:hypothetical protein
MDWRDRAWSVLILEQISERYGNREGRGEFLAVTEQG